MLIKLPNSSLDEPCPIRRLWSILIVSLTVYHCPGINSSLEVYFEIRSGPFVPVVGPYIELLFTIPSFSNHVESVARPSV